VHNAMRGRNAFPVVVDDPLHLHQSTR
jgi:hypothetical protein